MDTMTPQIIDMYSKLLRVPTFRNYEDVIQRLDKDAGYAQKPPSSIIQLT